MRRRSTGKFKGFVLYWLIAIALLPFGARALDFDAALRAYHAGDYQQAASIWQALATSGDAQSQHALGGLYFKGEGVTQDFAESTRWYRSAAEQGHALAQYNLGNAYQGGHGVEKDDRQSTFWWRRAAEQEVAAAQFNLALNYHYGRGVDEDREAAVQWIRRAANNGHARARELLVSSGLVADTAHESAPQAAAVPTAPARLGDDQEQSDWLSQQAPEHYTVQLMVTSGKRGADKFLRKHAFQAPVAIFTYTSKYGKPLYGIVHGSYATHDDAQRAVADLPTTLRKLKPFIRRFSSIHTQVDQ